MIRHALLLLSLVFGVALLGVFSQFYARFLSTRALMLF